MNREKEHFMLQVKKKMYKHSTNRFVNYLNHTGKCNLSSSKTIHNEAQALREFDKMTKKGIDCSLTKLWKYNGKGWYTRELESTAQEYFNNPDYELPLKDEWDHSTDKYAKEQ